MRGAHLWKRILNEGLGGGDLLVEGAASKMERLVITTPIIVGPLIDNTAEPDADIEWAKYKVSIPFPVFWCEWSMTDGAHFGSLVETRCRDDGFAFLATTIFAAPETRPEVFSSAEIVVNLDGSLRLSANGSVLIAAGISPRLRRIVGTDGANVVAMTNLSVALELLTLLNCKNVSLRANDNESKEVRRAVKRHGGTPDSYRYHTLVVRPAGSKSDAPAQDLGVMPRHVCRGHYAEYGPEFGKGLLFGKHAGRFYIPPHLKGDKKNGTVEKDYVVPSE